MSEEEILNMKMLIGHLDLTTDTKNKLYNQTTKIEDKLNKQKELLDKIKEYINNNSLYEEEYDYDYEENIYLSGVNDTKAKEDINKLLEEIE